MDNTRDEYQPATESKDPQRRRFPRWTLVEQDLWIDMLEAYSCTLIDPDTRPDEAEVKIRTAATLADIAIQEMQYRFWLQRPPRAPRARAKAPQRSRRTR